jgi:hypothetical protein
MNVCVALGGMIDSAWGNAEILAEKLAPVPFCPTTYPTQTGLALNIAPTMVDL